MYRNYSSNPSAALIFSKDIDFKTSVKVEEQYIALELLLADNHAGTTCETRDNDSQSCDQLAGMDKTAQTEVSKSMYVIKLLEMIDTVLEHESHLFSPSEIALLHQIKHVHYFQQYLISRLVQRKRGKWHRFDHLLSSYVRDFVKYMNVPEPDVPKIMADSLLELCANLRNEKRIFVPPGQKDVIDLTLDSDDDEPTSAPNPNVPDTCAPAVPCPSDDSPDTALEIASFAEDTASATPAQLLECLTLDELKLVGKRLKVSGKTKQTRVELVKAILHSTSTQTTLLFAVVSKPLVTSPQKSKNDWRKLFPFKPPEAAGKRQNMHLQERRIREMCSEIYGACFRLRDEVFRVLHLVSVVYFRSTEYSESDSIMLSAILATTGKRNYPKYEYKRTAEVFETRIDVLRYMETSQLLNQVENILEGVGQPPGVKFDRLKAAQDVISLWEAHWDRWNSLVAYLKDKSRRQRGLERFEEGYLLTRLVYKAADSFGTLKQYDMELKLLEALLRQTRWRRSKRGRWYDRMALIYTMYMGGGDANLHKAREILLKGLNDQLVHLGSRPMMLRRLQRLEKRLRIPPEEVYVGEGDLKSAIETRIEGTRVYAPPIPVIASKQSDSTSVLALSRLNTTRPGSRSPTLPATVDGKQQRTKWTGKSIWVGKAGDVNVETLALEYYATLGFRGFHSEGSIVSTLFGLLFWDILFAPVPGAFETPYQSAPLDLVHDSFFTVREDIIEARLAELTNGHDAARRIIEDVDSREREHDTWCVGVRWDLFERNDLLEIVDCLGGRALATICRLLAEEYGHRGGGVPDLFVWNASDKTCKFVEVKGPGDNLSETQKVWIDVLLGAGVDVEVCRVYEHGKMPIFKSNGKRGKSQKRSAGESRTPGAAKRKREDSDQEPDPEPEEEEDELWSSSEDGTGTAEHKNGNSRARASISPREPDHPRRSSETITADALSAHPEEHDPTRTSAERDALDAGLDSAKKTGARTVAEMSSVDVPASGLTDSRASAQMDRAHTTLLRSITSLPAPVPPFPARIKLEPDSGPPIVDSGPTSRQETVVPETPEPMSQCQPLAPTSSLTLEPRPEDSSPSAKPGPSTISSPRKRQIPTPKQWRDTLKTKTTPAKKNRKETESSPVKSSLAVTEPTPKRKRGDSLTLTLTHTPARKPALTLSVTPKTRVPDSNGESTEVTRTLRKRRRTTSGQTGVAGNPLEWEQKWPEVFPQWVGGVGGSSDPEYEPSQ